MNVNKMIKIIKRGGVGVLPTDTLYGLVGRALDRKAVERIYRIKVRNRKKPFIILISSLKDLEKFGIFNRLIRTNKRIVEKFWPGPVSIVLPCPSKKFQYLHRGKKRLAFRLPDKKSLITILKKTGPLVAPSANPEDRPPARTTTEAKKYFGGKIDFYVSGGFLKTTPSTVISFIGGDLKVLRKGSMKIKPNMV